MKRLLQLLLILGLPSVGFAVSGPVTVANETGLTYSNTYPVNLQSYGSTQGAASKLAASVTYSSVAFNNATLYDGQQSTGSLTVVSTSTIVAMSATDTITVPSTSAILGTPATNQITVVSTTGLAGLPATYTFSLQNYTGIALSSPVIVINGQYNFTYGTNWASTDTIQHAATTLNTAIAAAGPFTSSVVSSTGVAVSMVSSGTFANNWAVASSSPTDTSSGTFSGGADPVNIQINTGSQNLIYTYGGNWVSSDTTNHVAATLCSAIVVTGGADLVTCNAPASIVYASATVVGTSGNAFSITTSSASRVSVSSSSFLGGQKPALLDAYFSLNGTNYKNGYYWSDVSGTSTGTAASINSFINSVATFSAVCGGGLGSITSTVAGGVVTLTEYVKCAGGNNATLAATPSSGGLTVGSANFTGGQDNASIAINGTTLTLGTDWPTPTASSTTANVATAIATAINANAALKKIVAAQASANVVVSTSVGVGLVNYTTISSTQTQLSFANATMTNGTTSAFTLGSGVISAPGHGFTKALPLLLSTGGSTVGPLVDQTTYYAVIVDVNDIGLSSTSAVAQTGNYLAITSTSTQTSKHTLTLAPIGFTQGSAAGKWQVSNDGVNWVDYSTTAGNVSVASQTFTPVYPSTTSVQDFGLVDYGWMQYKATGPTWGGVALKVILNAKD